MPQPTRRCWHRSPSEWPRSIRWATRAGAAMQIVRRAIRAGARCGRVPLARDRNPRLAPAWPGACAGARLWLARGRHSGDVTGAAAGLSRPGRRMSAYLRRLVARSRGTLETVQPRVPARFEAWSEPMAPIRDGVAQAAPEGEAEHQASSRVRREAADDAAPITPGRQHRRATPLGAEALPDEADRDSAAAPAARAAGPDPWADTWENPSREPPPSRIPAWQALRSLPPATADAALPIAASPQMPPMARMPAHAGPAPQRRGIASATFTAAAAAVATDNVVHVTIGRVDVRAVAPPVVPPQRPRAAPRGPGLEEWLAGRSRP